MSNLDRLKKGLARLVTEGHKLMVRMMFDNLPDEVAKARKQKEDVEKELPNFDQNYQRWYSESLAMLSVLLPDRVGDFKAYYQLPRPPKGLDHSTYTISDYIRGTRVTAGGGTRVIVDRQAAMTPMQQQCEIVKAAASRFESSLFDIRGVVQADLFDNELDATGAEPSGFSPERDRAVGDVCQTLSSYTLFSSNARVGQHKCLHTSSTHLASGSRSGAGNSCLTPMAIGSAGFLGMTRRS